MVTESQDRSGDRGTSVRLGQVWGQGARNGHLAGGTDMGTAGDRMSAANGDSPPLLVRGQAGPAHPAQSNRKGKP
jgi:hypothetical protein